MRVRNFFFDPQIANCKSANFVAEPVHKLQIRKFYTVRQRKFNMFFKTIKKSTAGLFGRWEKLELEHFSYVFLSRKIKNFLQNCGSFKSAKNLGQQILNPRIAKNIGSSNCKSANCHTCGRSANVTNFVSPQIWGFSKAWRKMIPEKNLEQKIL